MLRAKDIMERRFHSLSPDMTISEAIQRFEQASREESRRVFGMIVTDQAGRLTGMLSMYDDLLFVRPKHIQVWGSMTDIEVTGLFDIIAERTKLVHVEDLMTTDVITITPDTHVMHILDIMIKKHIRRLPVVEDGVIEGMVYISDLFYFLVRRLIPDIA